MGAAYGELMSDRSLLLMQLQGYAACGDPEVREVVRRGYAHLYELVRELSGADPLELQGFFATGMLINVAAAMDLPELFSDETWMKDCLGRPPRPPTRVRRHAQLGNGGHHRRVDRHRARDRAAAGARAASSSSPACAARRTAPPCAARTGASSRCSST